MYRCFFFQNFPVAGMSGNEKMKKKKKLMQEPFLGYCPNNVVKKNKKLYCKVPIVLQLKGCSWMVCIAM